MEQEFLKEKAEWISRIKYGDITAAAKIAGVQKSAFHTWVSLTEVGDATTSSRNLKAIKEAIRNRENQLREAIAA